MFGSSESEQADRDRGDVANFQLLTHPHPVLLGDVMLRLEAGADVLKEADDRCSGRALVVESLRFGLVELVHEVRHLFVSLLQHLQLNFVSGVRRVGKAVIYTSR